MHISSARLAAIEAEYRLSKLYIGNISISKSPRKNEIDSKTQASYASRLETQLAIVNRGLDMANTTLVRITNTTNQVVTIMVSAINAQKANPDSSILPQEDGVYQVTSGASLAVELQRVSVGQLDNLRNLGQISYA